MTYTEAIALRTQQLNGTPVGALALQEALHVIQKQTPKGKGGRPYKERLPKLNDAQRERMNSVLLFNIGKAIGRMHERKAAFA